MFVKKGPSHLVREARTGTQAHFYDQAQRSPNAPRVAQELPLGKVLSFVDWQNVNLLPQSFASFYFHSSANLLKEVTKSLEI